MAVREPARIAVVASLLYAASVIATCPCDVLGSCKQRSFYIAALAPVGLVAFLNATGTQ